MKVLANFLQLQFFIISKSLFKVFILIWITIFCKEFLLLWERFSIPKGFYAFLLTAGCQISGPHVFLNGIIKTQCVKHFLTYLPDIHQMIYSKTYKQFRILWLPWGGSNEHLYYGYRKLEIKLRN